MQGRPSFLRATYLSLLGLCLAAAPALAADDVWVSAGQPSGGQIFKIVADPTSTGTLYALANPGIYKSTDNGAKWTQVLTLMASDGNDLAVDPVKPSNVYVANDSGGFWKSTDSGKTWNQLSGISNAHLVVVDPVNEGVVYAIAKGCDVYKSADGGATWSPTGVSGLTGNADAYCTQIAVDSTNPQILYLSSQVGSVDELTGARDGSSLSGLYSSVDGGAHWTQHLSMGGFADVVIDPSNDQNVYAGNYVSNDAGANWAPIAGADSTLTVIAVDPANPLVLWGVEGANIESNLTTSTDQGAHWAQVSITQGNSVYNVVYDPHTPTTLYAASMAIGVYKSTDGGATWGDAMEGISGVFSIDMVADSTGAIYMGTGGSGVYKSTDGGVTWAMKDKGLRNDGGATGILVESLVEAGTPGTLYETDKNQIYRTVDGGDNWTLASPFTFFNNGVAVDPERAETVYAATRTVQKSTDGGVTWNSSGQGLGGADGVISIAVDPTNSDVVYAGTENGVYKSTDGAASWSQTSDDSGEVPCIAVDPKTATNIYACGNVGISKSTDGGATWSTAGNAPDFGFSILQIDPNDPDVVYAVSPESYVYVSTDAGATWNALTQPASSAASRRTEAVATAGSSPKTRDAAAAQVAMINAIAVDPRHAAHAYGVAGDGRVYTTGVTVTASGGSSGGGTFPLLCDLLLLGLVALRRKS